MRLIFSLLLLRIALVARSSLAARASINEKWTVAAIGGETPSNANSTFVLAKGIASDSFQASKYKGQKGKADEDEGGPLVDIPSNITGEWTTDLDHMRMPAGLRQHLETIEKREHGAREVCTRGGRGHIYFLDPYLGDGENYVYHLQTPWKLIYPSQLKDKLRRQGFSVLHRPDGMGCDVWDPLFSVRQTGVQRGSVELNWPETNAAVLSYHRKPWVVNDWMALHVILEETYPMLEITMTVIGSLLLAGVVGIASLAGYMWACRRFGWHNRTKDYWQWRRQRVNSRATELN